MTGRYDTSRPPPSRRYHDPSLVIYALLAYVPLLATAPGKLTADTKAYLYLDPGRLLSRAGWLWEQDIGAGTITHQNIGYLFPMGPYYWLLDRLGVPDWIAQRLWLGSILFAAGAGVRWLCHRLDLRAAPATVAGLVYLTSPYILPYFGRTSALLLPWAALPWLIALVIVSLRTDRWRAPVLFALVLTWVGGTNASSLVFVAIGPLLWLPYAIWGLHEVDVRRGARVVARLALATVPAQLWWVAGLRMQGRYGLPILQLTESVDTVAQTSTAAEVSRGMGYWYDYGRDGLAPWTASAKGYTQHLWLIATSFALPMLALGAACLIRWRMRAYVVALFAVGLVLGVGTYPYDDPPLFGALVKATTETAAGLALRNTPRAVPLVSLAYALFIGAGVHALLARFHSRGVRPAWGRGLLAGTSVLALLNMPALFTGAFVSADLRFPDELPKYWLDAAAALDAKPHDSRVLELPGSDFAAYRWGQTQDPITPGLIDRPWIGRELTAFGTPGSVDLIRALDRRAQEGVFDARAVAPVARLLAVGDVLVRNDTQYERYRGPRPRTLWPVFAGATGFGALVTYGSPVANVADPRRPMRDEIELGTPATRPDPPPLASLAVSDPNHLIDVRPVRGALLIAGDGEGLVDAAEAGLVDANRLVLYSATFADRGDLLRVAAANDATLVLTDGNRKRAQRWGTVRENNGYTEPAGSSALEADTKDTRLALFPNAGTDSYTVARYVGVADIAASSYGNIVAFSPERRAANILDGDLRTSWEVGGFSDVVGERVRITLQAPITTDHIDIAQSNGNRSITTLGVRLDGGAIARVETDDTSHSDAGQRVQLGGTRTFTSIELSIERANVSGLQNYLGWSTAGIREVVIPGVSMEERIVVPRDLLDAIGPASAANDLAVVLTRQRADAAEPFRADPEQRLVRTIALPSARTFALRGEVRLETRADGATIDRVIGRPGTSAGFAIASGTDFLAGAARMRPSSALDRDPSTYWSPNLGDQNGRSFHVELARTTTVDHIELDLVADGWHSVPTRLTLVLDAGGTVVVDLPPLADATTRDHVEHVSLAVPPFTTAGFRVEVSAVRDVTSIEYFSGEPRPLPVGIAELDVGAAVRVAAPTADLDPACRNDLLTIDATAIAVRLRGASAAALDGRVATVETCDGAPIQLGPGEHVVRSANGIDTGLALDRVVLESKGARDTSVASKVPTATIAAQSRNRYDTDIRDATEPFWLVLHESLSDGWVATIDGASLGPPTMVDGYANGWLVDPSRFGPAFRVSLRWTPQRIVWIALGLSGAALALLVGAALWLFARDRRASFAWTGDISGPSSNIRARRGREHPSPLPNLVAATTLWGVVGFVLGGVVVGIAVAGLVLASRRVHRARGVLRVVPWASYAFIAIWYVLKQYRNAYPMGVEWPDAFATTHAVALVAMISLVADTVLSRRGAHEIPPTADDH